MDYAEDELDPYAGYDPEDGPEPFEFYDEGVDPYGDDELYFADGVQPPEYDEFEEIYDEPIYEEPMYTDDWLPVPPDAIPLETLPIEERPPEYGTELYIGGLQHPDPASMRDSYCQYYPEACGEGQQGLSGREPYNRTEAAEEMSRTLKDVDITGVAIAALLLLVLLFGLHYGGGDSAAPAEPSAPDRPRDPRPTDPAAEKAGYDAALKAAGLTDDKARGKKLEEVMKETDPKKRKKMVDDEVRKFYDKELKDAGYKDAEERKQKVNGIMQQPVDKRADKLKEYKDRKKGPSGDPPDTNGNAPRPERARNQEQGRPAPDGDQAPSEEDIQKTAKKLADAGIKDKDNKEAKRIAALPRNEQSKAISDLKKQQTKDGLDAALKKAGYTDDAERKKLVDELAGMDSKARAAKLKELEKAKKGSPDPPPPNGTTRPGAPGPDPPATEPPAGAPDKNKGKGNGEVKEMTDAEIKDKLKNARLSEPTLQDELVKEIRKAGGPAEQKAKLDEIMKKPREDRIKMNDEAKAKAKAAEEAARAAGQAPPGESL